MSANNPPELHDNSNFKQWKRDVTIWQLSTDVAAAKQAPRCFLQMRGKVREHISRMTAAQFAGDANTPGMANLLAELEKYFSKDETQELFLVIDRFESYTRSSETISEYCDEFLRRNARIAEITTDTYNGGILAYRLLKQAALSTE